VMPGATYTVARMVDSYHHMIVSDEALGMGIASPSCERELMMGDVIESLARGDDFLHHTGLAAQHSG
jgi:hypothetical protein